MEIREFLCGEDHIHLDTDSLAPAGRSQGVAHFVVSVAVALAEFRSGCRELHGSDGTDCRIRSPRYGRRPQPLLSGGLRH